MKDKAKHIFLIIADSLRYDSVYQNGDPKLPYTQAHSTAFTNVSSPACWTLPATASLFTGLLPHEHLATAQSRNLIKNHLTLAERLKAQGYFTYQITANVATTHIFGLDKGFDKVFKTWDFSEYQNSKIMRFLLFMSKPRVRRTVLSKDVITAALSEDIRAGSVWLESHMNSSFNKANELAKYHEERGEKCFFFINLMESHFPYHINHKFKILSKGPIAAARELRNMFHFVNQSHLKTGKVDIPNDVMQKLKQRQKLSWDLISKRLDSYIEEIHSSGENRVIFGSDHGENFGDQDWVYHFSNVTDACTRVPYFWLEPGQSTSEINSHYKSSRAVYHSIAKRAGDNSVGDHGFFNESELSIPISQTYWYNNKGKTLDQYKFNQFVFSDGADRYLYKNDNWYKGVWTDYSTDQPEKHFEPINADVSIDDLVSNNDSLKYIKEKWEKYKAFEIGLRPKI